MVDKSVNQQVLGGIMLNPQYLSEIDKYNLSIEDLFVYNDDKINAVLNGIKQNMGEDIESVDACIVYDKNIKAFKIEEEKYGILSLTLVIF